MREQSMRTEMKFYVCRRIRLLSYLLDRGFNFIETRQDRNNPKYKVWIFIDTPDLEKAIKDYYSQS